MDCGKEECSEVNSAQRVSNVSALILPGLKRTGSHPRHEARGDTRSGAEPQFRRSN